jgi:hypothetical protein
LDDEEDGSVREGAGGAAAFKYGIGGQRKARLPLPHAFESLHWIQAGPFNRLQSNTSTLKVLVSIFEGCPRDYEADDEVLVQSGQSLACVISV